jgi:2-haloalkanoic acid dehalogenase type II
MSARVLSAFSVLSFDCYGTLIDWESGILEALAPWIAREGLDLGTEEVLEAFARHESAEEAAAPETLYPTILERVHRRLASEWSAISTDLDARTFGESVGDWQAFSDSSAALASLARHYRLAILSNVDRDSFSRSNERLGVEFDWIFTADDIGSYKPDPRNFEHMLRELERDGIGIEQVLHTAQSLSHDHLPAAAIGLATNWIDRRHHLPGWGATMPPAEQPRIDFRHTSMADFANRALSERGSDRR